MTTHTDRGGAHARAAVRWTANVTVHGVGESNRPVDDDEGGVWISVEQLDSLLDAAVGRPDVAVTFDDGNLSDLEIALPRLLERGLVGRFFVPTGLLGEPGRLDRSDVRELHRAGMLVGSHGWAHRDWRTLWRGPRGPRGTAEVEEELVRPRQLLGRITGTVVSEVALPFGSYDRHVLAALRRTGATRVYTSDGGWVRPGAWLQARTSIRADAGPTWAHELLAGRPGRSARTRSLLARTVKRGRGAPRGG